MWTCIPRKVHQVVRAENEIVPELQAIVNLVQDLPLELTSLFRKARTNRLRMQVDVIGLEDLTGILEHASEKISYSLLISSLVMASSVLVLAAHGTESFVFHLGVAGFVTSASFAFLLMFGTWRNRRKLHKRIQILRRNRGE